MNLPSKETIDWLKAQYPVGTLVELIQMEDPYTNLRPGDRGRVRGIGALGDIEMNWLNGSSLNVIYGVDRVKKVEGEHESYNA